MKKIRYRYTSKEDGFQLSRVKCPVCGSEHKNFKEVIEHTSFARKVKLLVECWSGNTFEEKPQHLYIIELNDLPTVKLNVTK